MEKPNLDLEIADLQKQANRLHHDARIEQHPIRKQKIIDQRGKVITKLSTLRNKKDFQENAEAIAKINELYANSDRAIVLIVNGKRTTLNEDLNVVFTFTCGHTKTAHVSTILSYLRIPQNKNALLGAWQANLRTSTVITSKFNCQQCRAHKDKKFKMFRRHSDKDVIGTCSVEMQII